jgi:hypothetical protein
MADFKYWFKNNWPFIIFAVCWGIIIYVWGIWGWNSPNWWFEEAGHVVGGTMGAITLLYLYKTYSLHGIFRFAGKKHLTKDIVEDVAFLGILWELYEMIWDLYLQPNFFPHLARAQSGIIDTVIDLMINPLSAFLTMVIYFRCVKLYALIYKKIYPDDTKTIAVEEEIEETLEILRYVGKKVQFLRKEHLKQLRPTLKELVHLFKESRKT